MTNRQKWFWPAFILVAACLALPLAPCAAAQREPVLVGRIAYIEGQILRYVPENKDWVIVTKDAPFGLNDALYSDAAGKAEFIMPNALWVRIGASTQIQLIALKSDASEMDVASGVARFYNRNSNGMLKVTTPFGYVLADPNSTFDLYVGDQSVEVLAINGRVDYFQLGSNAKYEVTPGGASILADATQVATGDGTLDAQWDDWNATRDTRRTKRLEVRGETVKYVPPQLQEEAADLDESGTWERVNYEGQEREVWRPSHVEETWRPFTHGRWTDYDEDQVWVPDEPFGYVTHHYGNWLLVGARWYWAPPAPVVEVAVGPTIGFGWYPGRVAWISNDEDVGWVPLAPTEVYYSHNYWGPSAVVVAEVPAVTIGIGGLAFVSSAVIVPQADFYSPPSSNYSSVTVTNINNTNITNTTIINNFHAAPVVNNTVVKNYNQTNARYNFVNKAPEVKPHASVTEKVQHNRQAANSEAKSLSAPALRQAATSAKVTQPLPKAAVTAPTKLTNKLVSPNQVNAPKDQASFKTMEMKKNTKPIATSPAVKAGGTAGGVPPAPGVTHPPTPGVTPPATHPPAPATTQPPAPLTPGVQPARPQPPGPGVTHPPTPGVTPPATHPQAPATTQPPAPVTPGVQPARPQPPTPGVTHPPTPGVTPPATHPPAPATTQPPAPVTPGVQPVRPQPPGPGVTHPPAPATTRPPAPKATHPQPAPAPKPQVRQPAERTHQPAPATIRPKPAPAPKPQVRQPAPAQAPKPAPAPKPQVRQPAPAQAPRPAPAPKPQVRQPAPAQAPRPAPAPKPQVRQPAPAKAPRPAPAPAPKPQQQQDKKKQPPRQPQ